MGIFPTTVTQRYNSAELNHFIDNYWIKMKTIKYMLGFCFVLVAFTAFACPKGQHPHGGTGSHHKGGYCSYEQ
jgi:hypothetical protein